VCFIHNNHPKQDIVVAYQELVPWFMRVFLHTLKIETFSSLPSRIDLAGKPLKPSKFIMDIVFLVDDVLLAGVASVFSDCSSILILTFS
jgi:uncharacterized membrane protein YadS